MRTTRTLLTCLPLLALPLAAEAGRTPLTKEQKAEVRRDIKQIMGWEFRQFSNREPVLHTQFSPLSAKRVQVDAQLVSNWRKGREVQYSRLGIIRLLPRGGWQFQQGRSANQLYAPKDPVGSVKVRENVVGAAAVVRRTRGATFVIYDRPESGDLLRIAKVDAKTGRILDTSPNLAKPVVRVALAEHRERTRGGELPISWAYLGRLAKNGKSIEVKVYSAPGPKADAYERATYRLGLDENGAPTGPARHVKTESLH